MVFSGTKSLHRSVGWYIKARAILFLYLRRLISYIVDGTTQKLKEFRFVPSANTQAALDGALLLVKRPRPIKTRGFMFSEASVEKRATKALFWSFALSQLACNAFSSPKICNAKLAISSAQANKQYYTWKSACVRVERLFHGRGKKLIEFFPVFFSVLQLATKFETRQIRSMHNAKFSYDAETKARVATFMFKFAIFVFFFFFFFFYKFG